MKPLEPAAGQLLWAAQNLAYNLDFIPDDKLEWKPAPTANSAFEIVRHLTGFLLHAQAILAGGDGSAVEAGPFHTREQAQGQLIEAAQHYAETLTAITPQDLERTIEVPFGKFPLGRFATMPVMDAIHHHGQIAYIQELLGDTESHFDMTLMG
jgi:hypothetical protein